MKDVLVYCAAAAVAQQAMAIGHERWLADIRIALFKAKMEERGIKSADG